MSEIFLTETLNAEVKGIEHQQLLTSFLTNRETTKCIDFTCICIHVGNCMFKSRFIIVEELYKLGRTQTQTKEF